MEGILITGASGGLGNELASIYARNNYNIILHGRNKKKLDKTVRDLTLLNSGKIVSVVGDLSSSKTIDALVREAKNQDISTLINNAAIYEQKSLNQSNLKKILEVNLVAPILLTQKIYPHFIDRGYGKIINIMSIDAHNAKGYQTGYTASKFGLRGFTDSLRFEGKDNNIHVVGVYLGGMNTEMHRQKRKDSGLCMNPRDVAQIIFDSTKTYNKTGVDSITINRQKY